MAHPYETEAKASRSAKLGRMGLGDALTVEGHKEYRREVAEAPSDAASLNADEQRVEEIAGSKSAGGRLDRPGKFARGGSVGKKGATTVNVIVAGGGNKPMAPPAPVVPPPMPAAPPPAAAPAGPPPMPMMGRKKGGRVAYPKMDYGSGGGLGRLEKVDEYGKNAKKG